MGEGLYRYWVGAGREPTAFWAHGVGGWGGGARCGVGRPAAAGGAVRRGLRAVQERCGRTNVDGLAAFVVPPSGG